MALTKEKLNKIKLTRQFGDDTKELRGGVYSNIGGGFSYLNSKKALEITDWDVDDAVKLLIETSEFGTSIVKG